MKISILNLCWIGWRQILKEKESWGKIAIEMIDKYDLIAQGIPQEVKNAIKFHEKIEKMEGRGWWWWYGNKKKNRE